MRTAQPGTRGAGHPPRRAGYRHQLRSLNGARALLTRRLLAALPGQPERASRFNRWQPAEGSGSFDICSRGHGRCVAQSQARGSRARLSRAASPRPPYACTPTSRSRETRPSSEQPAPHAVSYSITSAPSLTTRQDKVRCVYGEGIMRFRMVSGITGSVPRVVGALQG